LPTGIWESQKRSLPKVIHCFNVFSPSFPIPWLGTYRICNIYLYSRYEAPASYRNPLCHSGGF